ncbi:hypothetical protein C8F01DRAFT_1075321 [Mycena amicta]|nr:hypothetical protein C8F01DRAFT_1075321 [Mycena amicta]
MALAGMGPSPESENRDTSFAVWGLRTRVESAMGSGEQVVVDVGDSASGRGGIGGLISLSDGVDCADGDEYGWMNMALGRMYGCDGIGVQMRRVSSGSEYDREISKTKGSMTNLCVFASLSPDIPRASFHAVLRYGRYWYVDGTENRRRTVDPRYVADDARGCSVSYRKCEEMWRECGEGDYNGRGEHDAHKKSADDGEGGRGQDNAAGEVNARRDRDVMITVMVALAHHCLASQIEMSDTCSRTFSLGVK